MSDYAKNGQLKKRLLARKNTLSSEINKSLSLSNPSLKSKSSTSLVSTPPLLKSKSSTSPLLKSKSSTFLPSSLEYEKLILAKKVSLKSFGYYISDTDFNRRKALKLAWKKLNYNIVHDRLLYLIDKYDTHSVIAFILLNDLQWFKDYINDKFTKI